MRRSMKKRLKLGLILPINMRIFLLSLFLVCLSCKSQKKGIKNQTENMQSIKPTLVLSDNYSNIDSSQISILKDQKALQKFFIQVNKTRKPGLPVPDIDFSKEMLILVCAGEKKGKYESSLTILKDNADFMTIKVAEKLEKGATQTATTTPFYLYKMPKSSKEVSFIKE
jgi:hypothetical protein